MRHVLLFMATLLLLLAPAPARAVITSKLPLAQILKEQPLIFIAEVREILPEKPSVILMRKDQLKGKVTFERMPVNLTGDAEAKKDKHSELLLERLEVGQSVVVFASRRGNLVNAMGFTNGTWFSLQGTAEKTEDGEIIRWAFTHAEPYMRRTFKGTTAEMRSTIEEGLGGKASPPDYDDKEVPGYGPVAPKKKSALPRPAGPELFAVIQLPFLGLIAALAALFPAVFGGLALTMKRWMVLMSTVGFISLISAMQLFFPLTLKKVYLHTDAATWLLSSLLAGFGAIYAASRYRKALLKRQDGLYTQRRYESYILVGLVAVCLAGLGYARYHGESWRHDYWLSVTVALVTCAVALGYYILTPRAAKGDEPALPRGLSAETVTLWGLTTACLAAAALESSGPAEIRSGEIDGQYVAGGPKLLHGGKPLWTFTPEDNGAIVSTPCLTPDGLIAAVQHSRGTDAFGVVYCLDPDTGAIRWTFHNEDKMLPIFSSPLYHDGTIFLGEGFHKDKNCHIYAIDSKTGTKKWEFEIKSHAESTPALEGGILVIGAGNDGIYGINAVTGEEIWHYTGETGLHIDANPAIHQSRVFASSGFSRTYQINQIFALDLKTGQEIWKERVDMSAYGSPLAVGDSVYFGLGNGTFSEDREPIAGRLLARNAADGKPLWDQPFPNSVLAKPVAYKESVIVGSRAGSLVALERKTGKPIWQIDMMSPVLSTAALVINGNRPTLYITSQKGRIAALDPATGDRFWEYDLAVMSQSPRIEVAASPLVIPVPGSINGKRRIYLSSGSFRTNFDSGQPRLDCLEDEIPPTQ